MTAPLSYPGRLLKFQFETALEDSRSGKSFIPVNDFNNPHFLEDNEKHLEEANKRTNNIILIQYYITGAYLRDHPRQIDNLSRTHKIALFLFDYFYDESDAIFHLNEVATWHIEHISGHEKAEIIRKKPPKASTFMEQFTRSPSPVMNDPKHSEEYQKYIARGPNDDETGELWGGNQKRRNSLDFWGEFFNEINPTISRGLNTPETTSKKRAFSSDDNNSDSESYHHSSKTRKLV